jgi:hypothetical protein
MPIKANESVTLPAVVIRKGDSQAEHTTLTIDGTWTHTLAAPLHQSFAGKIQIEMLEYTHKKDTWNLDFQVMVDASGDHLIGGLFYNSGSGFDGYQRTGNRSICCVFLDRLRAALFRVALF